MKVKGDGIFSINTSASGGFGNAGISLPEDVADTSGGVDMPPITTDLLVYYDPDVEAYSDDGTTLAVDGDNIRQFNDQSGNGNTLNQTTASLQPLYDTTTFSGGLASIKSKLDSLILTSELDLNNSTSFTFYHVYKKESNSNIVGFFKGLGTYPRSEHRTGLFRIRDNTGASRYASYTTDTNIKILAVTVDRSADEFKGYINGSFVMAHPSQVTNWPVTISQLYSNDTKFLNSGNVLFYTAAHDATDVGTVSDWLNTKYSIY